MLIYYILNVIEKERGIHREEACLWRKRQKIFLRYVMSTNPHRLVTLLIFYLLTVGNIAIAIICFYTYPGVKKTLIKIPRPLFALYWITETANSTKLSNHQTYSPIPPMKNSHLSFQSHISRTKQKGTKQPSWIIQNRTSMHHVMSVWKSYQIIFQTYTLITYLHFV